MLANDSRYNLLDMLELKIRPGPAGLLFQPVFPAQNETHLVGFATTSIHWQSVLEAVVPDYVSGLTCVVATETSSYTFEIQQGAPELVGDGDLHDTAYTDLGRSVVLNEIPTGSMTSAVYYLTVYPTDTTFAPFQSNTPLAVAVGFAGIILLCTLLFGLYDFLMRREAHERKTVVDHLVRENKLKANDNVWAVKKDELEFDKPAEILGQGTFGLVLLAQYRGTSVAVKRVIPPRNKETREAELLNSSPGLFSRLDNDVESGTVSKASSRTKSGGGSTVSSLQSQIADGTNPNYETMKEEFKEEMRYLSRLRHPCVTTVMGAVIDEGDDPLLIMELMEHGSLYDLLHNETMVVEGEILLPILRDISQGMRFLHAADPQVIHGDLKAQNILVDKRFRAKVADFGLSQKKQIGGTGSIYWMAPELLRKESINTSATDVFSFGVILYEVYSRKDPFQGENAADVLRDIIDKDICKRVVAPDVMPAQIKLLMEDCLQDDPEKRPSFEEVDLRLKRIDADTATPSDSKTKGQVSLFDIFPRHIAEALRDGRPVEADHKDVVTIFFSDIVGFTDISAELEPSQVACMLDRLYRQFDDLTTKHDLYKIETIGDAFMAATNLVKDQSSNHCKLIAQFAIDAIEAANQTLIDIDDPSKGKVEIRVGFHSGPVVADVVGHRNPRYCLFGDAVNVAARMESNSEANRINCSEKSAHILQEQCPEISLIDRGEIPIKGKGLLRCYWVDSV